MFVDKRDEPGVVPDLSRVREKASLVLEKCVT